MDIINNLTEKVTSTIDNFDINIDDEHKTNVLICIYIIAFLILKPYKATEIAKMPIIQLSIIAVTLHIARTNYVTASLIAIAFLVTLMIDTEENEYSRDTPSLEIEDREKFSGKGPKSKEDDEDESDSDDDDDDDDDDEVNDFSDDSDEEDKEDDEDESDSDDEEKDDINAKPIKKKNDKNLKKLKTNKKRLAKVKEAFSGGLIPKNSINDTFKDLHIAIHKLEHFINTEN